MASSPESQSNKPNSSTSVKHDVIVLLKQDHAEVKKLFKQFEKLAEKESIQEKVQIANKICAELTIHATAEEKLFYPEAREATQDDDLLNEAVVEHDSAKDLIAQIQTTNPEDPMYDAKVKVLGEYINHHVEEEETEMFPKVRESKQLDLKELAEKLIVFKAELMNKLVDTAGVIDQQKLKVMIGV